MASTFDENKRIKSDHSSCQSWFQHIGLDKSNNFTYSAKLFSVRRKTKSSSKSVNKSDPSTTDQENGQDSELGEAEPTEDSDPDLHRLQSSWNDFCLVYCDHCSYHYAHPAFMRHKVIRHVQVLDASVYQHSLYTEKTIPVHDQKKKKVKNGRKIVQSQTKNPVETEDTKNIESKSNVVTNLDVKSGPGPGYENLETDPVNGNVKSALGNGNRKKKRRKAVFGPKNKKPKTDWTLQNDHSSDNNFQDVILKKCEIGIPSERFNGDRKKDSAHKISSVKCVEKQEQASIFHKVNDAYLEKLGNGRELKSWKTKPVVKLKRKVIQEKLINQLASPVYNKCLETIKLEPMKIKKALNSINRVCRTRKLEQFRTFSHLKRIMPSSKNSPHRTRVSCSVNTGAKSACIKSGNKVPNRNQSRKIFFPLMGRWQTESGLVFPDCPNSTLRNAFDDMDELDPSLIEKMDFLNMDVDMDLFQNENYAMPTTTFETLMETEAVTTLINPVVTVKNENYTMPTTTVETPKETEVVTTMVNPVVTTTLETSMETGAVTTMVNPVVTTTLETPMENEAVTTMINPVVTVKKENSTMPTTTVETSMETEAVTSMINSVVTEVENEAVETKIYPVETEAVTSIISSIVSEVENENVDTIIYPVETEALTSAKSSIVSEVENEAVKTTIYSVVTTNEIDLVATISNTVSHVINNDANTNMIEVVLNKSATDEIEKLVNTSANFKDGLESNEHEGRQNGLLPILNESPPWDSDPMKSNNLDSGYLSHYDHQPGSSKSGSPDSFSVSPSYSSTFEENKINKEPRQNLMCFLPTKGHNGINGYNYLDHNRKPKQGCTER